MLIPHSHRSSGRLVEMPVLPFLRDPALPVLWCWQAQHSSAKRRRVTALSGSKRVDPSHGMASVRPNFEARCLTGFRLSSSRVSFSGWRTSICIFPLLRKYLTQRERTMPQTCKNQDSTHTFDDFWLALEGGRRQSHHHLWRVSSLDPPREPCLLCNLAISWVELLVLSWTNASFLV